MKNKYRIDGDNAYISVKSKGIDYETVIDASDIKLIDSIDAMWFISGKRNSYVTACPYVDSLRKKQKTIYLQRILTNCPESLVVDHINHNTLDNRQINLRVITNAQNLQNRIGANKSNKTSGIRGVTWDKQHQKWCAQVGHSENGKLVIVRVGLFYDKEDAAKAASDYRRSFMPFSEMDKLQCIM